jgi:hypothetical protein
MQKLPNFKIARFLGTVFHKHRNAADGADDAGTNGEVEKNGVDETPPGRDDAQAGADDAQVSLNNIQHVEELKMAKLDDVTRDLVNTVDGALGCAIVDMSSGLMLSAYHNVPYFTQTYLEAVAAAAVDMIRGKNVQAVEQLLSAQRGESVEKSIQEIQMSTEATYHFMAVVPNKSKNSLLVLITSKKTNLGMGWSNVRRNLPILATMVP